MKLALPHKSDTRSATITQALWLMVACSIALAVTSYASDPAWWSSSGAVNASLGTNDYAVVNQGQLKQFTARAVDQMNSNLTSWGAGTNLTEMVTGWSNDYSIHGYSATNIEPSDYQAMNVGQLKYIGNLIWGRLQTAGFTNAAPAWLDLNTNTDPQAANIGQLKTVFDFDISSFPSLPHITSSTTASGTVGGTFTYTITADNSPTGFGVVGTLPGLSFNTGTGVISGMPTAAGAYALTLSASNVTGTSYAPLLLSISPAVPVITSGTTASGTTGAPFTYTITASNTPTSFSATGLPSGLTFSTSSGIISGTPTASGTATVALGASNAGGSASTVNLALTISNPSAPVITSGTVATGDLNVPFIYTITASNNPTNFTAGSLPAGLSVNGSTGVISGTPTGTATLTATVPLSASNAGGTGTVTLALTINGTGAPVISSGLTATAFTAVLFNYQITATHTPASYGASGLPTGLSVNTSTGAITGTPTGTSTASISSTIYASNSSGTGGATLIFSMNPPMPVITNATVNASVGVAFDYTIVASNGPTSFTATGLPPGLGIDSSTGAITGIPTATGTAPVTSTVALGATNAGGTGTGTLTLTVSRPDPVPVINSGTMVTGDYGVAFSYAITTSTLPAPTSYNATGLPTGLSINTSTGVISGTTTVTGTSAVTLSASNAWGTGTATLNLTINSASAPVIISATTASGNVGTSFSYAITTSGSVTTYSATGLPVGLTLNTSTGAITGTPIAAGGSTVLLHATNSAGTGTTTMALTINPPAPVITSATTATGTFGIAINPYTITASNSPTSFGATGLPPGLFVDPSTGIITGTPTVTGTWTVTLSGTNAGGSGTANLTYAVSVGSSLPVITTRSVAAGDYHTLLLKSDGTVWTAGLNLNDQLGANPDQASLSYVQVSGLSGVVAIAAQGYSSFALKSDGTVWGWGYNGHGNLGNNSTTDSGTPVQVCTVSGTLNGIIALACGEGFTLALESNGTVWAWGDNSCDQLGSSGPDSHFAVQVSSLSNVVAIACGGYHSMAVKNDGTLWCWGSNDSGELGNGSTTQSATPVEVSGLSGVIAISGGGGADTNDPSDDFSVAVKNDGTVWSWGDNSNGVLGNGTTTESDVPVQVSNMSNVISVVGSRGDHVLALKNDGTVWAWGENDYGQLGNGTTTDNYVPVQVSNLTGVTALATGLDENIALKSDGTLWGWGNNSTDSQLGAGSAAATQSALPVTVPNLSGVTKIAAAKGHYLALKNDGTVWTWNDPTPSEISDGVTVTGSSLPVQVLGLSGTINAVACGTYSNYVLKNDGTVWAWGRNELGELGNGTIVDSQTPAQVSGLSNISAIASVGTAGMALKNDGTVWTWGDNSNDALGITGTEAYTTTAAQIPSGSLSGITAIAGAGDHAVALKSNGSVWTWGYNGLDALGNGGTTTSSTPGLVSGLSGTITAITSGYDHVAALANDGTVWTWGYNPSGQLGNGTIANSAVAVHLTTGLSGTVTQIASGEDSSHTLALKSDGTLWSWGCNSNGQLGVGVFGSVDGVSATGSASPVQVLGISGTIAAMACGKSSTIALKSDGTVLQWGDSSYEPLGFSVPVQVFDLSTTPAPTISPPGGGLFFVPDHQHVDHADGHDLLHAGRYGTDTQFADLYGNIYPEWKCLGQCRSI